MLLRSNRKINQPFDKSTDGGSPPADPKQWKKIFRAMVGIVQEQKSQIESLVADRRFLEDYANLQHRCWADRTQRLTSQIQQMKKEEKKQRRVQAAAVDLAVGLKERQLACYKKQYELAECDLSDFHECVETLNGQILELKGNLVLEKSTSSDKRMEKTCNTKSEVNLKEEHQSVKALEAEIRKLKNAYKKLNSKKEAEVSALVSEKDFVWNQFKKMECDYTAIIKSKRVEVDQANESIEKLQMDLAKIQSLLSQKDEAIAKLEAERSSFELDRMRGNSEVEKAKGKIDELQQNVDELELSCKEKDLVIAGLRNDLAKLDVDSKKSTSGPSKVSGISLSRRNLRSASATSAKSHVSRTSGRHRSESGNSQKKRKKVRLTEDASGSQAMTTRLQRCSNAEGNRSILATGSPRLFSANFKVPRLKDFSPAPDS